MCSADGFVNAHRWVASAALAPRSAVGLIEGVATSFSDGTFRERKSLAGREGFNFRPDMCVAT